MSRTEWVCAWLLATALGTAGCSDSRLGRVNQPPKAVITSEGADLAAYVGYPLTLRGSVSDLDDATEDLRVTWYVEGKIACPETEPEADGATSCVVVPERVGTWAAVLEVRDPDDEVDSASVEVTVENAPAPKVEIVAPSDADYASSAMSVLYEATISHPVEEPEDMVAAWSSSLDGPLTGEVVVQADPNTGHGIVTGSLGTLTPGEHVLELTAATSQGALGFDQMTLQVHQPVDELAVISGDGETGVVAKTLPAPLVVEARDVLGDPLANVPIQWLADDGMTVTETDVTGADGQASTSVELPTETGSYQVTALVAGAYPEVLAWFEVHADPDAAEALLYVSGDGQVGTRNKPLVEPLVVEARDTWDNRVPDAEVLWSGATNSWLSETDLDGQSAVVPVLGPDPGIHTFTAELPASDASPVVFEATADLLQLEADWLMPDDTVRAVVEHEGVVYLGGDFTKLYPYTGGTVQLDEDDGQSVPSGWPSVHGTVRAAVQDDEGAWILGGDFLEVGDQVRERLARILPDGTLDEDWNPGADDSVYSLSFDQEDIIYVGGAFSAVGGQPRDGVAALDADGIPTDWNPGVNGTVHALAVTDDAIFAGGSFTAAGGQAMAHLAAFDLDGDLGPEVPEPNAHVYALAVGLDGELYVGGSFTNLDDTQAPRLAALDSDAELTEWDPEHPLNAVRALAVAEDGTVYVGGIRSGLFGDPGNSLISFDPDGERTDWNPPYMESAGIVNVAGEVRSLHLGEDGLVYASGDFNLLRIDGDEAERNYLAAFDADGELTDWAPDASNVVHVLAGAQTGVLAGGAFARAGVVPVERAHLAAFEADSGTLTSWDPGTDAPVHVLAASSDGTIYAGGAFGQAAEASRPHLAAFDTGGVLQGWDPGANGTVYDLALAQDGTVYAGGAFSSAAGELRDGLVAIEPNGDAASWNPGANAAVRALALTEHGELYVGGEFSMVGDQARDRLAAFDTAGVLSAWAPEASAAVHALALGNDDTLYVGGAFGTMGDATRMGLASFDADGELSAWNPGTGTVYAITLDANENVYVAGSFKLVADHQRLGFAAFRADGTLSPWDPSYPSFPIPSGPSMGSSLGRAIAVGTHVYVGGDHQRGLGVVEPWEE